MRVLLLVVGVTLAACSSSRGQGHFRPSDKWADSIQAPPRWYVFQPGSLYLPAWEYIKMCSGVKPKPGGDYTDLHWLVVSSGGLRNYEGKGLLGVYLEPDTIVIDSLWLESTWLVAHEMLHHLLRATNSDPDPHPPVPFEHPCMVMFWQNAPHVSRAETGFGPRRPLKRFDLLFLRRGGGHE